MSEDTKRSIRAEDLYRFRLITYAELSPDGEWVSYALQRVDRESEKKYANIWLAPTTGGVARQFTVGKELASTPRWSPDGGQLAYLSNRDDEKQPQLYLISVDGGEAKCLTALKGKIAAFEWSPDGKRILLQFRQKDKEVLEWEEDEQKKKLGRVYRHIDRVFYSLDGEGYHPQDRWHIWTVDAASGETTQLTAGGVYDELEPTWSPDGERIACVSNRTPAPDLEPDVIDLYVISAQGGELDKINTPIGPKGKPSWSPDGQWLAYIGRAGRGDWWRNNGLWVVPADGEGEARNLLADYDLSVESTTINDLGGNNLRPPVWSVDGAELYCQISRHGNTTLHAVTVADGELRTVVGGDGVVGAYNFDAAGERWAYFHETLHDPGQLWFRESGAAEARQLTECNAELLAELELGEVEEVWFQGAAGNELQGWIIKPPNFDPQKEYPSIMEIHGGPWAQYGNFFMHEFYYLAAQGYVVYFCNPRGGAGYGEEHARAIWGEWGDVDYADLMAWADYLAAQPYIDPARMGVTGGSYGGYMTAWIVGHTDRFRAAVMQRSVTNLISMWGSSDMNWVFQQVFGDQPPYENIERLWQSSPMKHVGTATTPTLIIHSAQDLRCPLEQSQQFFVALKQLGVETEFVIFPGEPHGLSRQGRTDRRVARLEWINRWFERYL